MDGYKSALIAAGCDVHAMLQAGSYQGVWLAKVTTPDGSEGWVYGYYGSCSGCDAFEAEFGFDLHCEAHGRDTWRNETITFEPGCAECEDHRKRLEMFGTRYITDAATEGGGGVLTTAKLLHNLLDDSYIDSDDARLLMKLILTDLLTPEEKARVQTALDENGKY